MDSSFDSVLEQFEKWRQGGVRLSVTLECGPSHETYPSTVRARLEGLVELTTAEGLVKVSSVSNFVEFNLRGASFKETDPSRPPYFGGQPLASQFQSFLQIKVT
jgi:hypothetical protein